MDITINEYAKLKNVALSSIYKAIKEKRISCVEKNGKKLINPITANEEWLLKTNTNKSRFKNLCDDPSDTTANIFEDSQNDEQTSNKNETDNIITKIAVEVHKETVEVHKEAVLQAQRQRELLKTRMAELELSIQEGRYIDKEKAGVDIVTAWTEAIGNLKMIPRRLAFELVNESDSNTIQAKIEKSIVTIMETLRDELKKKHLFQ